jgi:hypothetical protein
MLQMQSPTLSTCSSPLIGLAPQAPRGQSQRALKTFPAVSSTSASTRIASNRPGSAGSIVS